MKFLVLYEAYGDSIQDEFEADNWDLTADVFVNFYNDIEGVRYTVVQYNIDKVIRIKPEDTE